MRRNRFCWAERWLLAGTFLVCASCGSDSTGAVTSVPGFQIDLRLDDGLSTSQRRAIEAASARWGEVVVRDLPGVRAKWDDLPDECKLGRAGAVEIDDLLIIVAVRRIDGPGGALAEAGPCAVRQRDGSPTIGTIVIDSADLESLDASRVLEAVVLHEMGHVLGFGTLWEGSGLVAEPSVPHNAGADTHFLGPKTRKAFDRVGGTHYTLGAKVPLENTGVRGSADGHWREGVFGNELMSAKLEPGVRTMPLSRVTIAALEDAGPWQVDYSAADSYRLPAISKGVTRQQPRFGCVTRGPVASIGPDGEVDELPGVTRETQ